MNLVFTSFALSTSLAKRLLITASGFFKDPDIRKQLLSLRGDPFKQHVDTLFYHEDITTLCVGSRNTQGPIEILPRRGLLDIKGVTNHCGLIPLILPIGIDDPASQKVTIHYFKTLRVTGANT